MARMKQTPRNPNINRQNAAIGSDVQSTEGRPTPRPASSKTAVKEKKGKGNSPGSISHESCYV